ncbi:MAG: bifunctional diguanylate cyclase/phosphodiesterase [Gammaproteobacteria bacterium]|nr:bifunctional diguanylate cyclase/phosphodiesterase [Gammaproteobacteria bacterium]
MKIKLDDYKIMYRLIATFVVILVGGLWVISQLYSSSYKVKDNMKMLDQDHLPRLESIYTLQAEIKTLGLVLYSYYETTDTTTYRTRWKDKQQKIKQIVVDLDKPFINDVNQYLLNLNTIAHKFDLEMQDPATDWDMLRNHLAESAKLSDEFDHVLANHAEVLQVSFKHYSDNTEQLISKMLIAQIAFSTFVLLVLAVVGFLLIRQLKQHQVLRELALYPEKNPYPVIRLNNQGDVLYLNPAAGQLAQSLGCVESPLQLLPSDYRLQQHNEINTLQAYESKDYPLGDKLFSAIFHQTDNDDSLYAYLLDVTDRATAEKELIYRSNHDVLTGLPNRRRLVEALDNKTKASQSPFSVLLIKVSRLDLINASLGHEMSDSILMAISARLATFVGEQTHCQLDLYSFESGSWIIIYNNSAVHSLAKELGNKLVSLFVAPLIIEDVELSMQCTLGISFYPEGGYTTKELLRNADAALRQGIKESLAVRLYSDDLTEQAIRWLELEQGLKHALDNQELSLHIQPKVNAQTGEFVGGEALIRWKYKGVSISPAEFIPIAEGSDLIIGIGEWALTTACQQWVAWKHKGLDPKRIAVNISAQHFMQADFVALVKQILNLTGMPAAALELEITEEVATENPEQLIKIMTRLKALGVSLAIDDFGTGYSSLSYLKQFPIDTLKIDKSFVSRMTSSENDAAIVRMIMSLAKELKLDVVAEGVEIESEYKALADLGCDYIQGFYFYKPLPLEQYHTLLLGSEELT